MTIADSSSLTKTRTFLDDPILIERFVQALVCGQPVLLSNPNLRAEDGFETYQLLSKTEGIIATIKLTQHPITVLVNGRSPYGELVHQAMIKQEFFPTASSAREGFYNYQSQTPPPGYRLNCTKAIALWRTWWIGNGHRTDQAGIELELLISHQGQWSKVQEIICTRGRLVIKILGGEVTLIGSAMLIWLQKVQSAGAVKDLSS